jgi:hypothetical protein
MEDSISLRTRLMTGLLDPYSSHAQILFAEHQVDFEIFSKIQKVSLPKINKEDAKVFLEELLESYEETAKPAMTPA